MSKKIYFICLHILLIFLIIIAIGKAAPLFLYVLGQQTTAAQPTQEKQYSRLSQQPVELIIEYSTSCSPTASHYYLPVNDTFRDSINVVFADSTLPRPDDSHYGVPGNQLLFKGYWVNHYINEKLFSQYFELYGWEMIPPYDTWNTDSSRNTALTAPVKYSVPLNDTIVKPNNSFKGC